MILSLTHVRPLAHYAKVSKEITLHNVALLVEAGFGLPDYFMAFTLAGLLFMGGGLLLFGVLDWPVAGLRFFGIGAGLMAYAAWPYASPLMRLLAAGLAAVPLATSFYRRVVWRRRIDMRRIAEAREGYLAGATGIVRLPSVM